MSEYVQVKLSEMIEQLGEDETKIILSQFACPRNKDVEDFFKYKAIEFSKQGLAKTTLVYWISDDQVEKYLVGYFAIAPKYIRIARDSVSNSLSKKMNKHGSYDTESREYIVVAPLIGQLGKNYESGNDLLVYGSDLLQMAIEKVKEVQKEIGGRFVFLECEDKPKLIKFYQENGFTTCGKRRKDRDEVGVDGEYLIQLIKYLHE